MKKDTFQSFFYYNYEAFDSENYSDKSVKKLSRIDREKMSLDSPSKINYNLQGYQLKDQSELF